MKHYDAMTNISLGSGGTRNVMRCEVDPSAYTSSSDAPESVSAWTQLEVAVSSARGEHEVTVQLVVQSHSDDAAVLMDDVSLEAETNAMPRRGTAADGSSATSVFSGTCSGGGGAGVSFTESHKCATDPTYLFYHIREKGGVPVVHEQVHAMVRIGYRSVKCRMPELDATSRDECPFLSEAALPHLSADDVRAYMDTLTDEELTAEMGWDDAEARGPEVMEIPGVALEILRAGLPEAIETGVVRVLDGSEYNAVSSSSDMPRFGASPTAAIIWHVMSGTSSFSSFDDGHTLWRTCEDHAVRRQASCYLWGVVQHLIGCHVIPALTDVSDWGDFVTFDGYFNSRPEGSNDRGRSRVDELPWRILPRQDFDVSVLPSSFLARVRSELMTKVGDNMYLCASSFHDLFRIMSSVPAAVLDLRSGNGVNSFISRCLGPVSEVWEDSLHVILPLAPVDGGSCVDFETIDPYSIRHFAGVHHARSRSNDHFWGKAAKVAVASGASVILICLIAVRVQRYNQHQGALRFPQVRPLSQRTLSSCKYISYIGVGAEAEVYLAEVNVSSKKLQIASKMYFRSSRVKSEMQFYEGLPRDDNILQVHGCYMDPETKRWCLAMEYCRHGNIRQSMAGKTFPRNGGFLHHGVTGVMRALATLHGNKMAHRDLKLDNVLLHCPCLAETECGCLRVNSRSVVPKLADFGMSRQGTLMQMSSADMKGTLMYIPPERVQYNLEKHDENFYELADIYALGLMIWEALYYVRHGEAVSCAQAIMSECHEGQDVLIRISSGTFVPPCDFLPEPIRRFLRKCWHVKPSRRYQNMTVVLNEWENLFDAVNELFVDSSAGSIAVSMLHRTFEGTSQ